MVKGKQLHFKGLAFELICMLLSNIPIKFKVHRRREQDRRLRHLYFFFDSFILVSA